MNLTDKGMQLKKGSRPSEQADGKVLKTQGKDAKERCPDCGEIVCRAGGCPFCRYCGWSRCP